MKIDLSKAYNFDSECDFISVEQFIQDNVSGLMQDEEIIYELAEILMSDFASKIVNWQGYIYKGIQMRMLIELRKCLALPASILDESFYAQVPQLADVKELRIARAKRVNKALNINTYVDTDWQYNLLLKICRSMEFADSFAFDLEYMCDDRVRDYEKDKRQLQRNMALAYLVGRFDVATVDRIIKRAGYEADDSIIPELLVSNYGMSLEDIDKYFTRKTIKYFIL